MKIYTRTGDGGETGLLGGERVRKADPRVEALGALDELNATLGRALGELGNERSAARLALIQHDLFAIGSQLARTARLSAAAQARLPALPSSRPPEMEGWIDEEEAGLPPLRAFILPGGCRGARELHLSRTVCRRAERRVATVGGKVAGFAVLYLNRLSDLLFVWARCENQLAGVDDIPWRSEPG